MKRLRITFTKEGRLKYISHLDLLRAWERLLRRARVPLAYSKGFNPHPRMAAAMPLAVGLVSEAELLDIVLEDDLTPHQLRALIQPQMPGGMRVIDVTDVPLDDPSLQSRLAFVEYRVELADNLAQAETAARVAIFLAAELIDRPKRQAPGKSAATGKPATYDLRALVDDIWLESLGDSSASAVRLGLRLKAGANGVGRPDEVLAALGLADCVVKEIRRTRLIIGSRP